MVEFLKGQLRELNGVDPLEENIEKSGQAAYMFIDSYIADRRRKQRMMQD